jgi:hypothetical protein
LRQHLGEKAMANWIRLTRTGSGSENIDVNLDLVAYVQRHQGTLGNESTTIAFAGREDTIAVKEKPDQIIVRSS